MKQNNELEQELKKENKAISTMGPKWKKRRNIYIALENHNINYYWEEADVNTLKKLVNDGWTIEGAGPALIRAFNRPAIDIRILLFDLALGEQLQRLPADF